MTSYDNEFEEFIPLKSPIMLDVMVEERYYTTIRVPVTIGLPYKGRDLRTLALLKLPSLQNKQFYTRVTDQKVFRN